MFAFFGPACNDLYKKNEKTIMNTYEITIGLVDPETLVRNGLVRIINEFENCRVVLQATNGKELQQLLTRQTPPDIVIMEVKMPVMNGFRTLEWLQETYPNLPVIILSSCSFELTAANLMFSGARALLTKKLVETELKKAIQSVDEQGFYYNDTHTRNILISIYKRQDGTHDARQKVLTKKEWKFLQLVTTDMTYAQIAHELGMSAGGVNKIRIRLFEKMNVRNRTCLSSLVYNNGLLDELAA